MQSVPMSTNSQMIKIAVAGVRRKTIIPLGALNILKNKAIITRTRAMPMMMALVLGDKGICDIFSLRVLPIFLTLSIGRYINTKEKDWQREGDTNGCEMVTDLIVYAQFGSS